MARPLKKGIDYFPLEVDIDEDDKFFDLFEEMGTAEGIGIIVLLLCNIYKNDGYFMNWNDSVCKKFSRNKHIDKSTLEESIRYLTGYDKSKSELKEDPPFFDPELFRHDKILTSSSIQRRFFLATDRRKGRAVYQHYFLLDYAYGEVQTSTRTENGVRIPIKEKTHYVTIDKKIIPFEFIISGHLDVNVNNNDVNVDINSINDNKSTQTKVNKSKVEESRLEESRLDKNKEEEIKKKYLKSDDIKEPDNDESNPFRNYGVKSGIFSQKRLDALGELTADLSKAKSC